VFVLFASFVPALVAAGLAGRAVSWWGSDAAAPHLRAEHVEETVRRHVVAARWVRSHLRPGPATASALATIAALAAVAATSIGVLLGMVRTQRGFARFDGAAARFGESHATEISTDVLRLVTQLGGSVVLVPLAFLLGVFESRRRRSWSSLAFLAVVFLGQLALTEAIKVSVSRVRPDLLRLTGYAGYSFPSGHATLAAATFAAFALLLGRGRCRRVRTALAAAAVGMAVLVAASRVTLGVHWLTDVLAGLILGWTWFAVTSLAFGGRRLRFGDPVLVVDRAVDVALGPAPARSGTMQDQVPAP
jgi:membrane-associated phospholipid phosphatase